MAFLFVPYIDRALVLSIQNFLIRNNLIQIVKGKHLPIYLDPKHQEFTCDDKFQGKYTESTGISICYHGLHFFLYFPFRFTFDSDSRVHLILGLPSTDNCWYLDKTFSKY